MEKIFGFVGSSEGNLKVIAMKTIVGESLPDVLFVQKKTSNLTENLKGTWFFKGVISNLRYTEKLEKEGLLAKQEGLGRPKSTHAVMILIKKNEAWWNLAQDERRQIMEDKSKHNQIGMDYLPAIARQLFHSKDIGEPFDFITWFEYAPEEESSFDELLNRLRNSLEWTYIEREVEVRMLVLPDTKS